MKTEHVGLGALALAAVYAAYQWGKGDAAGAGASTPPNTAAPPAPKAGGLGFKAGAKAPGRKK